MLPCRLFLSVSGLRSCMSVATASSSCSSLVQPNGSIRRSRLYLQTKLITSTAWNGSECANSSSTFGESRQLVGEKSVSGITVLVTVVDELNRRGSSFLLPRNDEKAMGSLADALDRLLNAGVRAEFVFDACVSSPELFDSLTRRGSSCFRLIQLLNVNCAFTYEDALRFISCYANDLLSVEVSAMEQRLSVLADCGIASGRMLGNVVRKCPALLFASDSKKMAFVAGGLSGFFTSAQILMIVSAAPQILLNSLDQLELKYEYLYFHMGLEADDLCDCVLWVDVPLEEIMMRHNFLQKTGSYTVPDPKRPQIKMENPKLQRILDSDEKRFATKIANVSLEEWSVFKTLSVKDADADNVERPYEKLKPSTRRAFERKWKAKSLKESYKFESEESRS